MRESPEAGDHAMMPARKAERSGHVARKQAKAQNLVRYVFAMHQRHEQELFLVPRQARKPIPVQRSMRQFQRQPVPGKGLCGVAVEIARYLIEQQDGRASDPAVSQKFARRPVSHRMKGAFETAAEHSIDCLAAAEPVVWAELLEPDIQQLARPRPDRGRHTGQSVSARL